MVDRRKRIRELRQDEFTCRSMVREMLETTDKGFSRWEIDFLESISRFTFMLSDKQKDTIEKIYKTRMK